MRKRTGNVVAMVLVGALMSMASPAVAQAVPAKTSESAKASEPAKTSEPSVVSLSDLGTLQAAPVGLRNFKSQKLLQPTGGSTANGARIVQQPNSGSGSQLWWLVADGSYTTFWNYNSELNMGVDGASTAAGAAAIQAYGSSHFNQDWAMVWRTNYEFNLRNRHSGLCLGIDGASTANGAVAMQFACNSTAPNQNWQAIA